MASILSWCWLAVAALIALSEGGEISISPTRNASLSQSNRYHPGCVTLTQEFLLYYPLTPVLKECISGFDVSAIRLKLDGVIASATVSTAQVEVRLPPFTWTVDSIWSTVERIDRDNAQRLLCSAELYDFSGPVKCPLHLEKIQKSLEGDNSFLSMWLTSEVPEPLVCIRTANMELEYTCREGAEGHKTHLRFENSQCFEKWTASDKLVMHKQGCLIDPMGITYGTVYVANRGDHAMIYNLTKEVRPTTISILYRVRNIQEEGRHSAFIFASEFGACFEMATERLAPAIDVRDNSAREVASNVVMNTAHVGTTLVEKEWTNVTVSLSWGSSAYVTSAIINDRPFVFERIPVMRSCWKPDTSQETPPPGISIIKIVPLQGGLLLDIDDIVLTHPSLTWNTPPYLKLAGYEFSIPMNSPPNKCVRVVLEYGDVDAGQALTLSIVEPKEACPNFIRPPRINEHGELCVDSVLGKQGRCSIVVRVQDDGHGTPESKTTEETIVLHIGPEIENTPPVFSIKSLVVVHDTYGSFSKVVMSDIRDVDPQQHLQVEHYVTPAGSESWLLAEPTVLDTSGVLSFKTHPGRVGNITLHVTLRDDGLGTVGGAKSSTEQTLIVSIVPKNRKPRPRLQDIKENELIDDGSEESASRAATVVFFGVCFGFCLCMVRRRSQLWKLIFPAHKHS